MPLNALPYTAPPDQADIDAAVAAVVDAAPATLNTLNELAAALGDDPNFLAALTTAIADQMTLAEHAAVDHEALASVLSPTEHASVDHSALTGVLTAREDVVAFAWSGALTTGTGTGRFRFPFAATLLGVSAAINTAPTGAAAIFDVNKNGTTIFTTQGNRPTIAISGFSAAETTPDVTAIAVGDYLTVDRDQIGSTIAGSDATVLVRYRRA
jgi:hypothetical protein